MTTTAVRTIHAEALQLPRRVLLQDELTAVGFVPDHEADDAHRTWLELTVADAATDAVAVFEAELLGAIDQAARDQILPKGGFLRDPAQRAAAIRAALVGAAAAIIEAATS